MHTTNSQFSYPGWRSDLQLLRQRISDFGALDPAMGVEIHRLVDHLTQDREPATKAALQQHMYRLEAAIFGGDDAEIAAQRRIVLQELEKLLPSA